MQDFGVNDRHTALRVVAEYRNTFREEPETSLPWGRVVAAVDAALAAPPDPAHQPGRRLTPPRFGSDPGWLAEEFLDRHPARVSATGLQLRGITGWFSVSPTWLKIMVEEFLEQRARSMLMLAQSELRMDPERWPPPRSKWPKLRRVTERPVAAVVAKVKARAERATDAQTSPQS